MINIAARLLGFAREVIIGYQYGTSYQADSIITAFTIPNFIYIVIGGAVTTAFISVYSKMKGLRKNDFFQTIYTGIAILIGIISLLFMLFPRFWVVLFFSGMSAKSMQLTSELFMWMAPATLFLTLAMVLSGLHNVYGNFRLTSFSTFVFNALFLLIGVGMTPVMMEYSYGLGASFGALMMLIILLVTARRNKLKPTGFKLRKLPETKRFIKMALPIMFGGATVQFYFIIQRIFASGLEEGIVSALNYASKMTQFPQAILMTSVTTVIYPMLAKAVGENDFVTVNNAYRKGFRMLNLILIPATVFIFMYAKDIITFIFEYGDFDASSTYKTYPLLQILSLSMLGLALNMYITRFFYAKENSYLPVIMNILSVFGVNIAVIILFIDSLGAQAIAWGTVISTIVNTFLLLVLAKTKLNLVASSWIFIMKMIVYIGIVITVVWGSTLVGISIPIASLLFGGIITLLLIGGGLKLIKE